MARTKPTYKKPNKHDKNSDGTFGINNQAQDKFEIISSCVLHCSILTPREKLILAKIYGICLHSTTDGKFLATNKWLAVAFNLKNTDHISTIISKLKKIGLIKIKYKKKGMHTYKEITIHKNWVKNLLKMELDQNNNRLNPLIFPRSSMQQIRDWIINKDDQPLIEDRKKPRDWRLFLRSKRYLEKTKYRYLEKTKTIGNTISHTKVCDINIPSGIYSNIKKLNKKFLFGHLLSTKIKNNDDLLSSWINWAEYRKSISNKSPWTEQAAKLAINKLIKFQSEKCIAAINHSIECGYRSFFPDSKMFDNYDKLDRSQNKTKKISKADMVFVKKYKNSIEEVKRKIGMDTKNKEHDNQIVMQLKSIKKFYEKNVAQRITYDGRQSGVGTWDIFLTTYLEWMVDQKWIRPQLSLVTASTRVIQSFMGWLVDQDKIHNNGTY